MVYLSLFARTGGPSSLSRTSPLRSGLRKRSGLFNFCATHGAHPLPLHPRSAYHRCVPDLPLRHLSLRLRLPLRRGRERERPVPK
ncbi:hypothetical protein FIBSPDRAFT_853984 [Athelia psychrophila]|uniref:Uncharacterized protein n=1 Tax=Athelia psychrophila TaxID=1759441 RepID=A0A166QIZ1_9AGAM|nr:hypothetical protein FIBSPDRAFT_853984 [Fibularhizoctonia sp. CBS 109695]